MQAAILFLYIIIYLLYAVSADMKSNNNPQPMRTFGGFIQGRGGGELVRLNMVCGHSGWYEFRTNRWFSVVLRTLS